jgi:methoxymalonate biosynthesis acyl carrier protein
LDIRQEIHDYLVTELASERDSFAPDENLLAQGIIDSMGILSLVSFMEARFGIKASDDDMVPENFETLEALRQFVERKKSA